VPEADALAGATPESDPTLRLAERLLQKGVGWVTLNHGRDDVIASLHARFPGLPVGLVAIDNVAFGRTQALQLRILLPKGGTVLCVRGNPLDTACRDRSAGLSEGLQGSSITVEEVDGRWEVELAEKVVHKWITSRRQTVLGAVVCQNDHMGLGARQALLHAAQDLGRPELKDLCVIGGDGLPDMGQRWVDDGTLTATVCVTLPGRAAVEQLARHWAGGAHLPPTTRLAVRSYPPLPTLSPAMH
jgi:ABC-type sugar transport system substrate-binding protein